MKKYLFVLLTTFILLLPFVKAEEYDNCYDDYLVGQVSFINHSTYWKLIQPNIPVSSNTTYYIRFFISEDFTSSSNTRFSTTPDPFDENNNSLGYLSLSNLSWDSELYILSFTTSSKEGLSYIKLPVYTYYTNYTILENAYFIISDNKYDLTTCPEKPDISYDPGIQETEQSKIVTNFYTLFIDRIKFISDYAINSYFFLTFIGVILCFVILKIFLYLYNRGGYQ